MSESESAAPKGGIFQYLKSDLRADATAGLTVAVMGVPQAMAYAIIAGLTPVYGLYVAIVTCAVAAALGSSRHLVTGPTNGICLVLLSVSVPLVAPGESPLQIILLLSFLSGVIQLGFGLLRMGGIVRYISSSVVIGFTAGAGFMIALGQMRGLLEVDYPKEERTQAFRVVWATIQNLGATNWRALVIGTVCGILVATLPKINRRLPAALIGVVVAAVVCYLLGWTEGQVQLVGQIEGGIRGDLDIFAVPDLIATPSFEATGNVASGALAVAILGLIEATSISRSIARRSGQRLDFNREFVGQGASKVVGSFFSCFAGSGSFTRTALNYDSGGRTRMAAAFSALWTLLTLVVFGGIANYIPLAALAGLLIVTAYSMIDRGRLAMSWQSGHNSRIVLLGTIVATLILPLQYAIYVGVFLSLVVILWTTGKTELTQLVPRVDGGFDEIPFNRAAASPVVTVNMAGDIYFAAAEDLDARLLESLTRQTKVVVLRMKRLRAVGSTAMSMLEQFWALLSRRGISLVVCGIEKELEDVMTRTGVRSKIGEANIFFADNKVFQSTELAMARARSIAEWRQGGEDTCAAEVGTKTLSAQDLMNTRCIRFGNKHQVREAVWLMSELHKHTKTISAEPLFLQDREGKLFGELSPWLILESLAGGAAQFDPEETKDMEDEAIAELLRRDFARSIRGIANTDLKACGPSTSLARLLDVSLEHDQDVTPVCDEEGRIKGLVATADLLRGLGETIALQAADQEPGEDA